MIDYQVTCRDRSSHHWPFRPIRQEACPYCQELLTTHLVQYRKVSRWHAVPFLYGPSVVTA